MSRPEFGIAAVADGMGGAASGEVASRIFTQTVVGQLSDPDCKHVKFPSFVEEIFRLANEEIYKLAGEDIRHRGMGCTAELIAFSNHDYVIGHVGDSRTYLFREGNLRQITRDHSLVQDRIDKGLISVSDARRHPMKNVILRAVGISGNLAVDFIKGECLIGDVFLLCSDGLSDMVEDLKIQEVLAFGGNLDQKLDQLVNLAKDAGGIDNITAVLCEVVSG